MSLDIDAILERADESEVRAKTYYGEEGSEILELVADVRVLTDEVERLRLVEKNAYEIQGDALRLSVENVTLKDALRELVTWLDRELSDVGFGRITVEAGAICLQTEHALAKAKEVLGG